MLLEHVRRVQVADICDGTTKILLQEIMDLPAECWVLEKKSPCVTLPVPLNKEKANVVYRWVDRGTLQDASFAAGRISWAFGTRP